MCCCTESWCWKEKSDIRMLIRKKGVTAGLEPEIGIRTLRVKKEGKVELEPEIGIRTLRVKKEGKVEQEPETDIRTLRVRKEGKVEQEPESGMGTQQIEERRGKRRLYRETRTTQKGVAARWATGVVACQETRTTTDG